MDIVGTEARRLRRYQKAAHAVVFVFHFGPDHGDIGDRAGGDPHFFAVQDVVRAVATRACAHAAGIGTEIRFRQTEAAKFFALRHGRQPLVLLLVGAEGVDGVHDERGLHADEGADAGVAALHLLRHQAVFHIGHSGAAVAVQIGAEEAHLAHRLHQLAGKAAFAVALFDDGDQVVVDEAASGVADKPLIFGEQGIEADEVDVLELESHCVLCPLDQFSKYCEVASLALCRRSSTERRRGYPLSPYTICETARRQMSKP